MGRKLSSDAPMVIERTTCEACGREIEEVGNWYECHECRDDESDRDE